MRLSEVIWATVGKGEKQKEKERAGERGREKEKEGGRGGDGEVIKKGKKFNKFVIVIEIYQIHHMIPFVRSLTFYL